MKSFDPSVRSVLSPGDERPNDELEGVSTPMLWLLYLLMLGLLAIGWLLDRPRAIGHWCRWQTICAWCWPRKRLKGAPWARNHTHGICPKCRAQFLNQPQMNADERR